MGDRMIKWHGWTFKRYRCTEQRYGIERVIWAASAQQAARMVAKYLGVNDDAIDVLRWPLYVDLKPMSAAERAEAA